MTAGLWILVGILAGWILINTAFTFYLIKQGDDLRVWQIILGIFGGLIVMLAYAICRIWIAKMYLASDD